MTNMSTIGKAGRWVTALVCVVLTGCARAPSVDILGSFFPIWIFCIVAGILVTVILKQILVRLSFHVDFGPPILIYPSFVLLFACVTWLVFFQ